MVGSFNFTDKFKASFENKCIRLLVDAYNSSVAKKHITNNLEENDITIILNHEIENNPIRLKWKIGNNVEHHNYTPSTPKVKGFSLKLSRIDLRFNCITSEYEYKYFMEAKNLKENDSALKRRYIDTGIDNFVSKRYPNGFLCGYLLLGTVKKTIEGINDLLKKDGRTIEQLKPVIYKYHKDYFESNYNKSYIIKHLIFDFT